MEFCFIINIYKEDVEQIKHLIKQIKTFYPICDIILIYDGVDKITIDGCIEISGDRLKYPYQDGRWTQRYLKEYLSRSDAEYLIKLDPDCSVIKEYIIPMDYIGVFGYVNLIGLGKWNYILQGGRYGIDRGSVKLIVESEKLLSNFEKYKNIQDLMMTDVLHQLNIKSTICKDFMDAFLHKKRGSEECRLYKLQPSKFLSNIKDVKETSLT